MQDGGFSWEFAQGVDYARDYPKRVGSKKSLRIIQMTRVHTHTHRIFTLFQAQFQAMVYWQIFFSEKAKRKKKNLNILDL